MRDLSHLDALTGRLAREKARLASATTENERRFRAVWVAQCEKEIAAEYKFLGIEPVVPTELSNDELAAMLDELDDLTPLESDLTKRAREVMQGLSSGARNNIRHAAAGSLGAISTIMFNRLVTAGVFEPQAPRSRGSTARSSNRAVSFTELGTEVAKLVGPFEK
jgi:hypothetical protein